MTKCLHEKRFWSGTFDIMQLTGGFRFMVIKSKTINH